MDSVGFDGLARRLGSSLGRRSVLGLAAAVPLGLLVADGDAARKKHRQKGGAGAEKKKKKGKAKTYCLNGQTVSSKKKKQQKKYVSQGATPGKCDGLGDCKSNCSAGACGGDDGCGKTCGCAAGSACVNGTCKACTVSCTGSASACGDALRTALAAGGDIQLCPGTYAGPFTVTKQTSLVGAGQGSDPASNSILDGQRTGSSQVVVAPTFAGNLTLTGLRVTRGDLGGVSVDGRNGNLFLIGVTIDDNGGEAVETEKPLTMTACTVTNNINPLAGEGGGMHLRALPNASNTIDASVISGNKAVSGNGGGIKVDDSSLFITATQITNNESKEGGGIHIGNDGGSPTPTANTLHLSSNSSVTNNNVTSGSATGAGIWSAAGGTVTIEGTVSGNSKLSASTPNQCGGNATC